jgi:hypothetical protein
MVNCPSSFSPHHSKGKAGGRPRNPRQRGLWTPILFALCHHPSYFTSHPLYLGKVIKYGVEARQTDRPLVFKTVGEQVSPCQKYQDPEQLIGLTKPASYKEGTREGK